MKKFFLVYNNDDYGRSVGEPIDAFITDVPDPADRKGEPVFRIVKKAAEKAGFKDVGFKNFVESSFDHVSELIYEKEVETNKLYTILKKMEDNA